MRQEGKILADKLLQEQAHSAAVQRQLDKQLATVDDLKQDLLTFTTITKQQAANAKLEKKKARGLATDADAVLAERDGLRALQHQLLGLVKSLAATANTRAAKVVALQAQLRAQSVALDVSLTAVRGYVDEKRDLRDEMLGLIARLEEHELESQAVELVRSSTVIRTLLFAVAVDDGRTGTVGDIFRRDITKTESLLWPVTSNSNSNNSNSKAKNNSNGKKGTGGGKAGNNSTAVVVANAPNAGNNSSAVVARGNAFLRFSGVAGGGGLTRAQAALLSKLKPLDPVQVQKIVRSKERLLRRLLRAKRSLMKQDLVTKAHLLGVALPSSYTMQPNTTTVTGSDGITITVVNENAGEDDDEDDIAGGAAGGAGAGYSSSDDENSDDEKQMLLPAMRAAYNGSLGNGAGTTAAIANGGANTAAASGAGKGANGAAAANASAGDAFDGNNDADDDDDDADGLLSTKEGFVAGMSGVPLFTGLITLPHNIAALCDQDKSKAGANTSSTATTSTALVPASASAASNTNTSNDANNNVSANAANAGSNSTATAGGKGGKGKGKHALSSASSKTLIEGGNAKDKDRLVGGARGGTDKLKSRAYSALIAFLESWKRPLGQLPSRAVNDICTAVSAIDLVSNWTARLQEVADNSSAQAVGRILVHYSRKAKASWRPDLGALFETFPLEGMVTLTFVAPRRAAAAAGLRTNDVLWACDGERVRTKEDLAHLIAQKPPGVVVTLTVVADSQSVVDAPPPPGDESVFVHRRAQFRVLRERVEAGQVRKVRVKLGALGLGSGVVAKLRSLASGVVYYKDVRTYAKAAALKKRLIAEGNDNDDDDDGGGSSYSSKRGSVSAGGKAGASPPAARFRRALQSTNANANTGHHGHGYIHGHSAVSGGAMSVLAEQAQLSHSAAATALIPSVFRVRAQAILARQQLTGATAALATDLTATGAHAAAAAAVAAAAAASASAAADEADAARFVIAPPKVPDELRCVEAGVRYVSL